MTTTMAPPPNEIRDGPDMPVPGARSVGRARRPLTVLSFLKECEEEWDRQKHWVDEAEFRERVVLGDQWRGRDPMVERVLAQVYEGETLITENLLYPLVLTWAARVNTGRVDPRAFPFQATDDDVSAARASNKILDYHKQKVNEDVLIAEAAVLAQMHGDCLFYPMWNEADGPHLRRRQRQDDHGPIWDIQTQQPVTEQVWEWGGITEEVVAGPDYWTSGEDKYKQAQWVIVRRVIDKYLAQSKLAAVGFDDVPPEAKDYPTAIDTSRRGVEAYELWLKPGPRSSTGMFAVVIDRRVVAVKSWPLKDKTQLPGAVWKLGYIRGCPRGKTHVSDAIHQQKLINRILRSIVKRVEAAEAADLFAPSQVLSDLKDNRFHRVPNDGDGDQEKRVFWRSGPEIPPSLFAAYDRARLALRDVFGMSEATSTGGDPTQSTSGAQLRTASSLDDQKIAPARRNLEEARRQVARQIIEMWQTNVDDEMLVRVLGADGSVDAQFVRGADIAGADVALEIRSGLYSTRLAGEVEAEQAGAAGLISPDEARDRRKTGLPDTVDAARAAARVDAQAQQAIGGRAQQLLPDVDPKMAQERVLMAVGGAIAAGGQPQSMQGAVALANAYKQAAAEKAKIEVQQQGQPGGDATQQGRNGPGRQQPSTAKRVAASSATKATKIRQEQMQPDGVN